MKKHRNTLLRVLAVAAVAALTAGLAAGCGVGVKTVVPEKTKSPSSSPGVSPDPEAPGSDDSASLPRYQPSTVVSDSGGSLQLTSPDPVAKVTAFYDEALAQGWTIISSSKSGFNTSITAKKGNVGTSLSISTTGSGSYISLVTYPI